MAILVFGGMARGLIAATPEQLWAIVADPTRHPDFAGSGEPRQTWRLDDGPIRVGSRFQSQQQIGPVRYQAVSVVTACEQPRLFRWNVRQADWDFRLEPVEGGTLVTHALRFTPAARGPLTRLLRPILGRRARYNIKGMVGTLRNLARLAGATEPTNPQVSYQTPELATVG